MASYVSPFDFWVENYARVLDLIPSGVRLLIDCMRWSSMFVIFGDLLCVIFGDLLFVILGD